jgi:hypothetical protein
VSVLGIGVIGATAIGAHRLGAAGQGQRLSSASACGSGVRSLAAEESGFVCAFTNCRGDDDVDAKRSRPLIGKPMMGHARKERVLLFGTDQGSHQGQQPKRLHPMEEILQAKTGRWPAPERFAEKSDSSCTAGAVIHGPPRQMPMR